VVFILDKKYISRSSHTLTHALFNDSLLHLMAHSLAHSL
jgi:hypothetical protein